MTRAGIRKRKIVTSATSVPWEDITTDGGEYKGVAIDGERICSFFAAQGQGRCSTNPERTLMSSETGGHRSDTLTYLLSLVESEEFEGFVTGAEHVCAIRDSRIYCAGENGRGQLGDGTTMRSPDGGWARTYVGVEVLW